MNILGKNIKILRKQNDLSQLDLAVNLNLSQTSVAHYEAGNRQPTIETLMDISQLFNTPIDVLVGNIITDSHIKKNDLSENELVEKLVGALLDKNGNLFLDMFHEYVYSDYDFKYILDEVLKSVLYQIGTLWEQGIVSEADEHYASNMVRKVVNYINIKNGSPIKNRKAILLNVGNEQHTIGLEMISTYLSSVGFESVYLGKNIPIRNLEEIFTAHEPEYVFLSITLHDSMNSLVYLVDHINETLKTNTTIVVGGQGVLDDKNLTKHSNLHIVKDINELEQLLEQ